MDNLLDLLSARREVVLNEISSIEQDPELVRKADNAHERLKQALIQAMEKKEEH